MTIKDFHPAVTTVPCDLCGAGSMIPFSQKMRHGLNLDTQICASCLLVQTNPQPTPASQEEFYRDFYHLFHKRSGVDQAYVTKSAGMAARRFTLMTEFLKADEQATVFEIGAGAGQFMNTVNKKSSWTIEGIEPGGESYQWCHSLGLAVTNVGIENYIPARKFNLVVSFHVLEHVISPTVFLNKCREMLEEGGLIFLEVPNFNSPGYSYDQFLQFPHLYNFTQHTLTNYLLLNSFTPVYVEEAVSYLIIIARKQSTSGAPMIKINGKRYLNKLKWKKKVYKVVSFVPSWPLIRKIKSLIYTLL